MNRSILLLLLLTYLPPVASTQLYRWVDDEGLVHYTDRLPPERSSTERAIMNRQGIEVDRIAPDSKEDIAKKQHIQKFGKLQEQMLKQREREDNILLQQYRSEQDILDARSLRIRTYDTKIHVIQSNISRTKRFIIQLQGELDRMRVREQQPDPAMVEELATLHKRINRDYSAILALEEQKQVDGSKYTEDLQRFRFLKRIINQDPENRPPTTVILTDDDIQQLPTLYLCHRDDDCESLWKRAVDYLKSLSDTPVISENENLILTQEPKRTAEISLTLSRTPAEKELGTWIFLDLNCKNTRQGYRRCKSEKADLIRSGFRRFLVPEQS